MKADNRLRFLFTFHLIEDYRNRTHILTGQVRFYLALLHLATDLGGSCANTGKTYPTEKCTGFFLRV